MRFTLLISALVASVSVLAAPADVHARSDVLVDRQAAAAPIKPPPCVRNPNITVEQTKARFEAFACAFIYKPNISEAFTFIAEDYINHNPMAKNGFDSAWGILSPIWDTTPIKPRRTAFEYPQGWLNYVNNFGTIVDRFRWEKGCIAEHWDQDEKFPTNLKPLDPVCTSHGPACGPN